MGNEIGQGQYTAMSNKPERDSAKAGGCAAPCFCYTDTIDEKNAFAARSSRF